MNQQLKDWAARTRSDINPIKEELEQGNYETAKSLIADVLQNFDELDALLKQQDQLTDMVATDLNQAEATQSRPGVQKEQKDV